MAMDWWTEGEAVTIQQGLYAPLHIDDTRAPLFDEGAFGPLLEDLFFPSVPDLSGAQGEAGAHAEELALPDWVTAPLVDLAPAVHVFPDMDAVWDLNAEPLFELGDEPELDMDLWPLKVDAPEKLEEKLDEKKLEEETVLGKRKAQPDPERDSKETPVPAPASPVKKRKPSPSPPPAPAAPVSPFEELMGVSRAIAVLSSSEVKRVNEMVDLQNRKFELMLMVMAKGRGISMRRVVKRALEDGSKGCFATFAAEDAKRYKHYYYVINGEHTGSRARAKARPRMVFNGFDYRCAITAPVGRHDQPVAFMPSVLPRTVLPVDPSTLPEPLLVAMLALGVCTGAYSFGSSYMAGFYTWRTFYHPLTVLMAKDPDDPTKVRPWLPSPRLLLRATLLYALVHDLHGQVDLGLYAGGLFRHECLFWTHLCTCTASAFRDANEKFGKETSKERRYTIRTGLRKVSSTTHVALSPNGFVQREPRLPLVCYRLRHMMVDTRTPPTACASDAPGIDYLLHLRQAFQPEFLGRAQPGERLPSIRNVSRDPYALAETTDWVEG